MRTKKIPHHCESLVAQIGLAVILALGPFLPGPAALAGDVRLHRLIVLTDIENEPDDTMSMVRLMLYSDVIDIRGLIATTSTHLRTTVAPESIRNVIAAYAKVRDNLAKHDPNYPTAEALLSVVKQGLPVYGMQGVGAGRNSEGSDWIIRVLEQDDPRPLWVAVWGGPNALAQALYEIKASRSEAEAGRLIARLRVYTISDQDDSAIWMRRNFPDLFYIVSPGGYGAATWGAINQDVNGIDNTTVTNRWLAANVQQGHGPLGAMYPDVAYGMEGDTPSWLALIPNGLNAPEHPDWGGWGGRYEFYRPELANMDPHGFTGGVPVEAEPHAIWTNAVDEYRPLVAGEIGRAVRPGGKTFKDSRVTLWRWRDDFQNDFAARMDWTTKPYDQANHPPVPVLRHPAALTVKSGQSFELDARGSTDPDGDSLSYGWFSYPEAGSYRTPISFGGAAQNTARVVLRAPRVQKPETAHFILKLTDKGTPPLTRYRRVIVTIVPE
jgi:hypothetical protein